MSPGSSTLLESVLVPIANEEDATITADRLQRYEPEQVIALYVVEKTKGGMDKTPVAHSEEIGEQSFDAVRAVFPDAETKMTYSPNVVDSIVDTARNLDVTVIAFRARGGNRLLQFVAGDRALKLIARATVPVVVLPEHQND